MPWVVGSKPFRTFRTNTCTISAEELSDELLRQFEEEGIQDSICHTSVKV